MNDNLSLLTPDPIRAARTLKRCHGELAKRRRRAEAAARARARAYLVERLLVAGVSVVYLMALAGDLADWYR